MIFRWLETITKSAFGGFDVEKLDGQQWVSNKPAVALCIHIPSSVFLVPSAVPFSTGAQSCNNASLNSAGA